MPRGIAAATPLPDMLTFDVVTGDGFIKVRDAAKLGSVHPAVLEMGQKLLKAPNGTGASFALATPELQKRATELERAIKAGLKRVAKALDKDHKFKVKSVRDGARLIFWYAT